MKIIKKDRHKSTLGKRKKRWICKLFGHQHNINPTEFWCSRCGLAYEEFSNPNGLEYWESLMKWLKE